MTHTDALDAAQQLSDLAIDLEAHLDPDITPFEAHLISMAKDTIDAVGHAHTIAAYLAARIQAAPAASPELAALGQRLASVGKGLMPALLPIIILVSGCSLTDAIAYQIWY